jgi:hypothetical protein
MTYNAEIHIQKPQPASDRALVCKKHKTSFLFLEKGDITFQPDSCFSFRKKGYTFQPPTFTSECVQPITTDL